MGNLVHGRLLLLHWWLARILRLLLLIPGLWVHGRSNASFFVLHGLVAAGDWRGRGGGGACACTTLAGGFGVLGEPEDCCYEAEEEEDSINVVSELCLVQSPRTRKRRRNVRHDGIECDDSTSAASFAGAARVSSPKSAASLCEEGVSGVGAGGSLVFEEEVFEAFALRICVGHDIVESVACGA